jgi:hypothetical protein
MTSVAIQDHFGRTLAAFEGEMVAEVTSDDGERARWIEITLYRRDDASGWAVHRRSMSVLYHRDDTTCRTPKQARPGVCLPAAQLEGDAEPCAKCRPPERDALDPDAVVRIEIPRDNVHLLDTDKQVVDDLTVDRRTGTPYWSQPVVELLVAAGRKHPNLLALIPQSAVIR